MRTLTRISVTCLLVAAQLFAAKQASAEGLFEFMKTWVSQAQSGVWCGIYGCESASVLAKSFNPRASNYHTCKQAVLGGPPSVEIWICLVEAGSPLSMPGDLDLVARNMTGKKMRVTADCKTTYLPGSEFMVKTVSSGDVGFTLGPDKRHDFYIIEAQLDAISSINWKFSGRADCRWDVQFEEEKKPEEPKVANSNRATQPTMNTASPYPCGSTSGFFAPCTVYRDARPNEGKPPADLKSSPAGSTDTACADAGDSKDKCTPSSNAPRKEEKWDVIQVDPRPCRWVDFYGEKLCRH
ncbi:hypothetical protein [Methylobacterium radiotolerans]